MDHSILINIYYNTLLSIQDQKDIYLLLIHFQYASNNHMTIILYSTKYNFINLIYALAFDKIAQDNVYFDADDSTD